MTFTAIGSNDQSIFGSKVSGAQNATGSASTGASASGLDGVYYIQSKLSGKYLNVDSGSSANNTNINQWTFNGSHAQTFKLVSDGNGYYSILTGSSNYASGLDVYTGSAAEVRDRQGRLRICNQDKGKRKRECA